MADRVATDKAKSSYQQELERRSNDILRVYNPTDEDYVVEYDRRGGVKLFRVTAKTETSLIRYIAEKYLREMFRKMQNDKAKNAILEENKRRISKGMSELDKTMKTNEQMAFEEKFYNLTDEEARKIMALLYVGVEQKFGVDEQAPQETERKDLKPTAQRAMESVMEEKGSIGTANGEPIQETEKEGFPCNYPGCDFVAKNELGLMSHKRTHRDTKKEAVAKVSK